MPSRITAKRLAGDRAVRRQVVRRSTYTGSIIDASANCTTLMTRVDSGFTLAMSSSSRTTYLPFSNS
jgi:hypothetical protein